LFEVTFEVKDTGEEFTVIACHWPSRVRGIHNSEPLRIAVAEHVAYLVESHVKVEPQRYEELREQDDIEEVRKKWDTRVLVVGDLNDEPHDRSIVHHLKASNELDRVCGETNDIDGFKETSGYRKQDVFLYNATWDALKKNKTGTYFIDNSRTDGKFANRYQVLDQMIASRGLVLNSGLTLDIESVSIFADQIVATASKRPRKFEKKTRKGFSDHLPVTAVLRYEED
jgi:hypothetical protein